MHVAALAVLVDWLVPAAVGAIVIAVVGGVKLVAVRVVVFAVSTVVAESRVASALGGASTSFFGDSSTLH